MRRVGTRSVQRLSRSDILTQVRIFTLWYWARRLTLVILSEISTLDLRIPLEGEGMKTIPHCWRASVSVFGCAVKIRDKAVCRLMTAESLVTCAPSIVRLSVCLSAREIVSVSPDAHSEKYGLGDWRHIDSSHESPLFSTYIIVGVTLVTFWRVETSVQSPKTVNITDNYQLG